MGALDGYTIGFIGLGLMGCPMAKILKSAGADMIVHNRSQEVVTSFKREGIRTTNSPANVCLLYTSPSPRD